ncbi:hypothetical protein AURDEDRAFT_115924 [Auricularia subglabra TFB-10046 SS5]|nr:hypothetical protein AURDEDRAFT_115924 [Auricularia subglabra TFB-10046 SS5]
MAHQITLYSAEVCPWAQRARIALREVGAEHTEYKIDLDNKPVWYASKVHEASKVPVIAYGGPKTDPENPSPESVKIPESGILVEFVADLFPDTIMPTDPVRRAQLRYFVDRFTQAFAGPCVAFTYRGEQADELLDGIADTIQPLLPADGQGPFFLGEKFSAAEALLAPFLARLRFYLESDIGGFTTEEGKQVLDMLDHDPRFANFAKYWAAVVQRPSVVETFPVEIIRKSASKMMLPVRQSRLEAMRESSAV